MTLFNLAYAMT